LDEALAELGIDRSAGTEGARRAYLRLLKTRKPETDPEGFMRLREAYQLVKSNFAFWEPARPAEIVLPPPRLEAPQKAAEVIVEAAPEVVQDEIIDVGRLSRRKAEREETEGEAANAGAGVDEHEDEHEHEHEHEDEHEDEDEDEDDEDEDEDEG